MRFVPCMLWLNQFIWCISKMCPKPRFVEYNRSELVSAITNLENDSPWYYLMHDVWNASFILENYTLELIVKKKLPTYWTISFTKDQLGLYKTLKKYTGEYGFIVPVRATRNKRVLKGEKKLKYKKIKIDLIIEKK